MTDNITTDEKVQAQRLKNLRELVDTYHRDKFGDYKDTYEEFEATYIPPDESEVCNVCGEERRAKIHTDTELHPDDATDGLTLHKWQNRFGDEDDGERQPIPRYAAVREDETYGMVSVYDNLKDALADTYGGLGEEYLNNPVGVFDLDHDGKTIHLGRIEAEVLIVTKEQKELLNSIFSDAYEYRMEDVAGRDGDDDPDAEDDNKQANEYLKLAEQIGVVVS